MNEVINICKKRKGGKLVIIDEKTLFVELNEKKMELYTQYDHKQYKVEGQFNFQYIIIGD